MAGDPNYLAILDALEPTDPTEFHVLDDLWDDLIREPRNTFLFTQIAEICFGYLAGDALDTMTFDKAWEATIAGAKDLHVAKNAGYAGADNKDTWANFRMCEAFGISAVDGVITRMSDKYIRIKNLMADPTNERVGESLMDTIRDLAAYALIAICLIQEQHQQANDEYTAFMIRELLSDAITAIDKELSPSFISQEAKEGLRILKGFRDA